MSAQAAPVLDGGRFFSNVAAFSTSGWQYTGTLPASFNAGFRARNDEDDCFFCERQYANGQRSMSVSTTGATPTYSMSMGGNFETEQFEGWSTNLLQQSRGTVWHGDVEKVVLVSPNGGIGNEHPIPAAWQSATGYGTTSNSGHAAFSQTLVLTRPYLNPGEGNCPIFVAPGGARTGHCAFADAYFQGGATLQATLQGHGSIENTWAGTQSVTLDAMSNRATLFKVNDAVLFNGSVSGTANSFRLEEESASAVDFRFGFNFSSLQLDLGANVQWDGRGETSSFNASYNQRVQMSDFVSAGRADSYRIEFRDEAQLLAGITGRGFNSADVLASAGVSSIDASLKPAYQPLASSLLTVLDASTFNIKTPNLAIPPGGFDDDVPVFLHFLLANEGSVDLTLDGYTLEILDEDFLFDDLIGRFTRTLDFLIPAGGRYEFGGLVTLSRAALNSAAGLGEGGFLELFGRGSFRFHDVFGSREMAFRLALPEPGSLGLVLLGGLAALASRARAAGAQRRQADTA